jgi:hypothetical protein
MIATNFKHYTKNTLLGFFDLELPSGMILRGCTLHHKSDLDRWWVSLPSKDFKKDDGTTGYSAIVEFKEKEKQYKFNDAATAAAREAFEKTPQPSSGKSASSRSSFSSADLDDPMPF